VLCSRAAYTLEQHVSAKAFARVLMLCDNAILVLVAQQLPELVLLTYSFLLLLIYALQSTIALQQVHCLPRLPGPCVPHNSLGPKRSSNGADCDRLQLVAVADSAAARYSQAA
jgi:hypothetical protein